MKQWKTGIVISLSVGKMYCHIEEFCDFLEWFTGHKVWSHDIPRLGNAASPFILEQFPWMKDLDHSKTNRETVWDILAEWKSIHGEMLEVNPMPSEAIAQLTPHESLNFAGVDDKKIITFEPKKQS